MSKVSGKGRNKKKRPVNNAAIYTPEYAQKLKEYKVSKADEKIIRRYILLLQDTAPIEYLIKVMAYVFRTNVENVHRILSETTGRELCEIAVLREKWKRNSERGLGYIPVSQRGDCYE